MAQAQPIATSEPIDILDTWRWPRLDGGRDNEAMQRAMYRGVTMFQDKAPFVEDHKKANGEPYQVIATVGYMLIWKPQYRLAEPQRRLFKVGRHPKWNDDLQACGFVIGEIALDERVCYIVDLDHQRCMRQDGKPCPAYEGSRRRWCKHLFGVAHALTRPIAWGKSEGVARFLTTEGDLHAE